MGWADVGEVIKAVAPGFTASAACFAAYIGYRGLEKWRHETIGRRRIELAEDALADFYEAVDIFQRVRTPVSFAHESEGRPGRDDDPREVRHHRDTFYVPLKRLNEHAEFFAKANARRYRVIATFGQEAAKPYDDLREIKFRIIESAQTLMRINPLNLDDYDRARREKLEKDVWSGFNDPDDEIGAQLKSIIDKVERLFRGEASKAAT